MHVAIPPHASKQGTPCHIPLKCTEMYDIIKKALTLA